MAGLDSFGSVGSAGFGSRSDPFVSAVAEEVCLPRSAAERFLLSSSSRRATYCEKASNPCVPMIVESGMIRTIEARASLFSSSPEWY